MRWERATVIVSVKLSNSSRVKAHLVRNARMNYAQRERDKVPEKESAWDSGRSGTQFLVFLSPLLAIFQHSTTWFNCYNIFPLSFFYICRVDVPRSKWTKLILRNVSESWISRSPSWRRVFRSWSRSPRSRNSPCSVSCSHYRQTFGCTSSLHTSGLVVFSFFNRNLLRIFKFPILRCQWSSSWCLAFLLTSGELRRRLEVDSRFPTISPSTTVSGSLWPLSCNRARTFSLG